MQEFRFNPLPTIENERQATQPDRGTTPQGKTFNKSQTYNKPYYKNMEKNAEIDIERENILLGLMRKFEAYTTQQVINYHLWNEVIERFRNMIEFEKEGGAR